MNSPTVPLIGSYLSIWWDRLSSGMSRLGLGIRSDDWLGKECQGKQIKG